MQIVTVNRPAIERPESRVSGVATPEQAQLTTAAFNSYYAYFGKWEFDEHTATARARAAVSASTHTLLG